MENWKIFWKVLARFSESFCPQGTSTTESYIHCQPVTMIITPGRYISSQVLTLLHGLLTYMNLLCASCRGERRGVVQSAARPRLRALQHQPVHRPDHHHLLPGQRAAAALHPQRYVATSQLYKRRAFNVVKTHLVIIRKRSCFGSKYLLWSPQTQKPEISPGAL